MKRERLCLPSDEGTRYLLPRFLEPAFLDPFIEPKIFEDGLNELARSRDILFRVERLPDTTELTQKLRSNSVNPLWPS